MKKNILSILLVILVFLFVTGCAINDTTGLIRIANVSDKDATVKIGNLSFFVAKGGTYEYWFTTETKGKVSADGISIDDVVCISIDDVVCNGVIGSVKDKEATFKVGYGYDINLAKMDNKYYIMVTYGTGAGKDMTASDATHTPF